MKKFEGILICTDLDGTLFSDDKTVTKENLDAIEYFKSEGGLFTFVTGRMYYYATDVAETVKPNAPIGCANGGGVYDYQSQEYLWKEVMDPSVFELVEYIDQRVENIGVQVVGFDRTYFCKENLAMEFFRKVTKVPNCVVDFKEFTAPFAKIIFGETQSDKLEYIAELLKAHPKAQNFDFVRSEKVLYEILPKGIDKGMAIQKLCELLNIDKAKTVAIGDYNNDIGMIKAAGVGVAVGNAVDEVKKVADHITVTNNQSAIAQVIKDIETGKIKI